MLYYISVCLLVWLSVGFLVGLKLIYFDGLFKKDTLNALLNHHEMTDKHKFVIKNKKVFLALCTLAGLVALIAELERMYSKGK
ncbi:hypothetical protein [Bacillus subtilis]|uniref:hypothetical protein n=1 Tax=Bacillus subtilis TaxID=1423 RepID=UPI00084A16BD|nr:hypothetical protein [Bacillus subtilis]ODV47936.1 hypothetical protein BCM26_05880 [Bacillus subtilis]OJH63534.1 hypothetical protein BOH71_09825 [Bacillus subtilis]